LKSWRKEMQLPLPALHAKHLSFIFEVLSSAWLDLMAAHSAILLGAPEAEINALMVTRLNALLDSDPMWRHLVRSVTRGTESFSFDGTSLEKRPDISVHLMSRNPSFALTIECKVIDSKANQDGARLQTGSGKVRKRGIRLDNAGGIHAWVRSGRFLYQQMPYAAIGAEQNE
jgi:hypothetical protein